MDFCHGRLREEAVQFGSRSSLQGVITDPPEASGNGNLPAFIFLNAGIVHRVGPHRLFVKLARRLAGIGFSSLRFDHSGIGDSQARDDNLPFEKSSVEETREAMSCLQRLRSCQKFVIVGLCSGTLTSFRTACCDSRVVGLVLLNGLLESADDLSQETKSYLIDRKIARSYWHTKIFHLPSWLKVAQGRADYRKIVRVFYSQLNGLLGKKRREAAGLKPVAVELRSLMERGANLLFVYSEGTGVAEYFRLSLAAEVAGLRPRERARVEFVEADHTFTLIRYQEDVLKLVCGWARGNVWAK
ncbi:MAG: alpha/beta hydrolase [Deltaproteobacteria bacterium]|nr:alpha/beta hydrolase [Deltaproteobacteria bacterium]